MTTLHWIYSPPRCFHKLRLVNTTLWKAYCSPLLEIIHHIKICSISTFLNQTVWKAVTEKCAKTPKTCFSFNNPFNMYVLNPYYIQSLVPLYEHENTQSSASWNTFNCYLYDKYKGRNYFLWQPCSYELTIGILAS